ncbi:WAT1-related protein At5g64700-like isoform X1 [Herrania umbratica]|uniref:WAT1-related protein n=1 Tax=Herrania umbratica TaxID=108875 RepID=A0A6J1BRV0_9ROSI|nr:WAT1-related protein At5g64700-like isoform X1 [Herrania umbratica]XP_021300947.1 WAT1-related protein At5g64700-like isoform X1 [Herrania umbratica]XP_021300948.1 WAT1-related protein At5g64700-like isoform X1 [Herrania umbratica]XP_021300949.1 WAT1-related protein At5g64700-like isoform X1 [Herrania umbratica]
MGSKKPFLAALLVHALSSGMTLLSKAAFNMGMSTSVFVFYRQVAGTIFLAPFAMIFEGKSAKPLSLLTFCKIFMLALLGITLTLNLYGVALIYTSASLGAATINCIPVITFAFAVLLRMEKVTVKTVPGIAKVAGILVSMAGVVTLAFYKGPVLQPLCHLHFQPHSGQDHHADGHASSGKKWILGCFLLLVSCICWALWLVIQAQILKSYPSKITFTSIQCLSSAVQSFLVAIALERDPHQWKLGWNLGLLAVVYCGIFVTGVAYYLQAWVIAMKGPVFHAVMTPSNLVMTILGSVFLLGETINLGSVLGAILLVISLYSVLWGKSTEQNMDNNLGCLPVQAQTDCSTQVKETPVLSSNPRPSLSM